MNVQQADPAYRRDLGNGLVLRWSTAEDTEGLVRLVSHVFRDQEDAPPNIPLGELQRALMSGTHPLMGPGDFALIEDQSRPGRPLVACTCLWRHIWEYEGIPFALGRPEIVASDPAYRHRGLVRALFGLIHARSEAEGHPVQAITGIPYFYRLFGYEYALDLGGKRTTLAALIPPAQAGIPEAFTLSDAALGDIPLLQQLYDQRRSEGIVSLYLDEAWWQYQITSWATSLTGENWHIQLILDEQGHAQGYVITQTMRQGNSLRVVDVAFAQGARIQEILLPLLRALAAQGEQLPDRDQGLEPFSRIAFYLGSTHPLYNVLGQELTNEQQEPYAWYVRVAHLPGFIQRIAPVLEKRLASSVAAGYSGELTFDFYRGGLRLVFARGKLETAEDWQSPLWNAQPDARFPELTFLQMLFGYRSLDELARAFPDIRAKDQQRKVLLRALFPARASWVIG